MPDQKISVDPAAADLSGCIIPVVTGGINKQAAASLFGITGVANGIIYSAGNRNTSDPTNFNYVPGTQTLTVVGPIRTSPVTNEATVATPANGMIIYSTALSKFRAYENGAWVNLIGGSGGAGWALTGISTLTGVATITSNAANQHIFNGTWSAAAAADAHITFGGTLTAASALGVTGYLFNPTLNALGVSSVQVAVDINPTFAGGTTPVNIGLRVKTGGVILGNFSGFASTEQFLIRTDQNATTSQTIVNATSGTAARAQLSVSTSSASTTNVSLIANSAAFTTAGIFVANSGLLFSNMAAGLNVGTNNATQLSFWTNNTEKARFLSTGEFLVGYSATGGGEFAGYRKDQNSGTGLTLVNATSGTAAKAYFLVSSSSTQATSVFIATNSASFTPSGINTANTAVIGSNMGAGMNIGTTIAQPLSFYINNVKVMAIDGAGNTTLTQPALSSAWLPIIAYTPGPHTSMTANAEFIDYDFKTRTATWLAGTTATQRFAYFRGQTVAGASASATFTDLYTVYIDPSIQGSQAIITNNWALGLGGGLKLFAGTTTRPALVLPTGTNLTTSQAGVMENDGTHLWFTFANSGARWQLDNQVGTFGWALAGNTLVADGIIGDVGTGGFKISLYTNNTARQVISSKGNFTFAQDAQSTSHTFLQFTQGNHTGGTPLGINYNAGGAVTLAANTEPIDIGLALGRTVQFATGAHGGVRAINISNPIYSFVGASTMTIASLISLAGAPIAGNNATITNVHGININSNSVVTGTGIVTNSYALTASAQTGATNNYAAQFLGGNVGIGLSAPLSTLDVSGSIGSNTRTITTSATLAATDHTVLGDATGGVVAATLPAAAGAKGRIYVVKKIDASANNVTLATVDGGTKTITTRYSGFAVQSDGSLWYVIASF